MTSLDQENEDGEIFLASEQMKTPDSLPSHENEVSKLSAALEHDKTPYETVDFFDNLTKTHLDSLQNVNKQIDLTNLSDNTDTRP